MPSSPIAGGSTAAAAVDVDAGLGLAFARGAVVGAVLVFLVCGGISLVAGASVAAAVGIGAFAAFWGGPGFGGMMGAVLHYSRHHPAH